MRIIRRPMNRKTSNFIYCLLVIFLVFQTACKENTPKKITEEKTTFVNDSVLTAYFDELYKKDMFNGAVAIKKDGELIFKKAYGTANLDLNTPFLTSTEMEIASVSKQFTAAAILILQQDGKLEVENKVKDYLGEDFPYDQITVQHLLTHTSGLPDYEKYFRETWESTEIVYNKDIVAYFKEIKPELISVPGEKYHYSNSGYVLLAAVVKAVSGKELDEFMEERIFKVAGMENSGFYDRDKIWEMKNYAPGYMVDLKTCAYVKPDELPGKYYYRFLSGRFGPGRLSSSLEDLIKWDSILYTDKILTEESKKLAFTPQPPTDDPSDYGFGWHIPEVEGATVVFHTGSWAGNLTYIKRFLDTRSTVILLNNTYDSAYLREIRPSLDAYVLKGDSLKIPQAKAELLLAKQLCGLDEDTILDWYKAHLDAEWNKDRLAKLAKDYRELGADKKADLVQRLREQLE